MQSVFLFLAAFAAGVINSVAGGGSFFTFPALVLAGVPSIAANATSTIAIWPGTVASIGAYRDDIRRERRLVPGLLAISLIGGLLGALILLKTPQAVFDRLLPWLLLAATGIFVFGPKLARILREGTGEGRDGARVGFLALVLQFAIATYAGYFGGGVGFLMLAMLSLTGMTDIHAMNGLKTIMGASANLVAIIAFVLAGLIVWHPALVMMTGAVAGGYGGATLARRVSPRVVRGIVIATGLAMTLFFFFRRT